MFLTAIGVEYADVNNIPSISLFVSKDDFDKPIVSSQTIPSVTVVLKETMSSEARFNLKRWEQRMIKEMGYQPFLDHKKGKVYILFNISIFHSLQWILVSLF